MLSFSDFKKLDENSLYKTPQEKDTLVKDKSKLLDAFYINFFAFIGFFKMKQLAPLKKYEQTEGKLYINNIDDTNHDVSLSIKLLFDQHILQKAVVDNMTKLLVKIKGKTIKPEDIDENIIRAMLTEMNYASHRSSPRVFAHIQEFAEGKITLGRLTFMLYQLAKQKEYKDITEEIRAVGVYYSGLMKQLGFDQAVQHPVAPTIASSLPPIASIVAPDPVVPVTPPVAKVVPVAPVVPSVVKGFTKEFVERLALVQSDDETFKLMELYGVKRTDSDWRDFMDRMVLPIIAQSKGDPAKIPQWLATKIRVICDSEGLGRARRDFVNSMNEKFIEQNGIDRSILRFREFSENFTKQVVGKKIHEYANDFSKMLFKKILAQNTDVTKQITDLNAVKNQILNYSIWDLGAHQMIIRDSLGIKDFSAIDVNTAAKIAMLLKALPNVTIAIAAMMEPYILMKFIDHVGTRTIGRKAVINKTAYDTFFKQSAVGQIIAHAMEWTFTDEIDIAELFAQYRNSYSSGEQNKLVERMYQFEYSPQNIKKIAETISIGAVMSVINRLSLYYGTHPYDKFNNSFADMVVAVINENPYSTCFNELINAPSAIIEYCAFLEGFIPYIKKIKVDQRAVGIINVDQNIQNDIRGQKFIFAVIEHFSESGRLLNSTYNPSGTFPILFNYNFSKLKEIKFDIGILEKIKWFFLITSPTSSNLMAALDKQKMIEFFYSSANGMSVIERPLNGNGMTNWAHIDDFLTPGILNSLKEAVRTNPYFLNSVRLGPKATDFIKDVVTEAFEKDDNRVFLVIESISLPFDKVIDRVLKMDLSNGNIIHIEQGVTNTTGMLVSRMIEDGKDFNVPFQKFKEFMNHLYNSTDKNKDTYHKVYRDAINNSLQDAFLRAQDVYSESEINELFNSFDTKFKKMMFNDMVQLGFAHSSKHRISNDQIVPDRDLKDSEILTILKINGVNLTSGALKAKDVKGDSYKEVKANIEKMVANDTPVSLQNMKLHPYTEAEMEKQSVSFNLKYNKYKHGNIALLIKRVWDVAIPAQQAGYPSFVGMAMGGGATGVVKQLGPQFHGTQPIPASMIARFGFKVIDEKLARTAGIKYAGRMLGDGIYMSNVIDKCGQYMDPQRVGTGVSRKRGVLGYLFELDAQGSQWGPSINSNCDWATGGGVMPGERSRSLVSPEWAVKDPDQQIKIYKCYEVEIIDRETLKSVAAKHRMNESYEQFIAERRMDEVKIKNWSSFTFMDGYVPVSKDKIVEFDKFDPKKFGPHVQVDFNSRGIVVMIESEHSQSHVCLHTPQFMSNHNLLTTYLNLLNNK